MLVCYYFDIITLSSIGVRIQIAFFPPCAQLFLHRATSAQCFSESSTFQCTADRSWPFQRGAGATTVTSLQETNHMPVSGNMFLI